ncbi:MAG: ABC transporter ATP-binding protein [Rhodobacter sp. BACL10 MAG-121220-bin24]|jgi:spermidine/putrescine transport system ATP-binding protein|nr:MAG: ABC transporter ATP-binding protein [Rhodobacter sp. BACL10 MAG-121220-bin24]
MNASVQLEDLSVRFGDFTAVSNVNLNIDGGEFFSFLGPSGCGKTTVLRTISGFLAPSTGRVTISGTDMVGIGPNNRPTALIFQNLALFPLMTVSENIAYGLRIQGFSLTERTKKADELLELVALNGMGTKLISELSGGQKQRVAIARALAVQPKVLLLDEPLSALDLKLRQHMRTELRAIQQQVGITFIYITHDQGEALTMSDRIAVMSDGVVLQVGDGRAIYDNPTSAFVASFVGENNAFSGRVTRIDGNLAQIETSTGNLVGRNPKGLSIGDKAILFVRPENLNFGQTLGNVEFEAKFNSAAFEGNATHIHLMGAHGGEITVTLSRSDDFNVPAKGTSLKLSYQPALGLILAEGALASD